MHHVLAKAFGMGRQRKFHCRVSHADKVLTLDKVAGNNTLQWQCCKTNKGKTFILNIQVGSKILVFCLLQNIDPFT